MEDGEVNVDAIGKNVLIVLLTGIVSNILFLFCNYFLLLSFFICILHWQVKEEEVVIAQITTVLNADTILIVVGDKHVVEAIANIKSADLIPIAKETRNVEDRIAEIGNLKLPIY